jgi:hypothetical protein
MAVAKEFDVAGRPYPQQLSTVTPTASGRREVEIADIGPLGRYCFASREMMSAMPSEAVKCVTAALGQKET